MNKYILLIFDSRMYEFISHLKLGLDFLIDAIININKKRFKILCLIWEYWHLTHT